MEIADRTVLITGAARGIGRALAIACAAAGGRVAVSDMLDDELQAIGDQLGPGHIAVPCDVTDFGAVQALVERVRDTLGPVDVCFANAGIAGGSGPVETPDEVWQRTYAVNVRQHVWLARMLLPTWLERREGYYVVTASAAGLLTQIGSAPYAVSKHAAVAFAEWLSVTYGDCGVRVSCVCPMGVDTAMLVPGEAGALNPSGSAIVRGAGKVLDPVEVANIVLDGIAEERFLILPHPEVGRFFERKASDYVRWLNGMRRLQATTCQ
jgi:NAD(P)-dependent dehydrogenase (short-subunit alcohol dehydrogenase family)